MVWVGVVDRIGNSAWQGSADDVSIVEHATTNTVRIWSSQAKMGILALLTLPSELGMLEIELV